MKVYKITLIALVLFSSALQYPKTYAQDKTDQHSLSDISDTLLKRLSNARYEEYYIRDILSIIRQHADDRSTLKESDIIKIKNKSAQSARERILRSIKTHDLNYDGRITLNELEKSLYMQKPPQKIIDATLKNIMSADTDNDNIISREEVFAFIDLSIKKQSTRPNPYIIEIKEFLALDPNKDQKLTIKELKKLATEAFRAADLNKDGILSKDETMSLRLFIKRGIQPNSPLKN